MTTELDSTSKQKERARMTKDKQEAEIAIEMMEILTYTYILKPEVELVLGKG